MKSSHKTVSLLFATILLLTGTVALAQAPTVAKKRPRIGLVLGGGGARGATHIGVLQV